jgi:hypothetical protein
MNVVVLNSQSKLIPICEMRNHLFFKSIAACGDVGKKFADVIRRVDATV